MKALFVVLLAHAFADPRVLVIVPSAGSIEVRLNDLEQPGEPSITMRRRFDADKNGTLSDEESGKLREFLASRATWFLELKQDGEKLALETVSSTLRGASGAVDGSEPLSLDVVVRAKAKASRKGRTTVEISDRRQDGHAVRAAVMADGVKIRRASLGSLDGDRKVVTNVELGNQALRLEWENAGIR